MELKNDELKNAGISIRLTDTAREILLQQLSTEGSNLTLCKAYVEEDFDGDYNACVQSGSDARKILFKIAGNMKGHYYCSKTEYDNLCNVYGVNRDEEETLAGKVVIAVIKHGTVVAML